MIIPVAISSQAIRYASTDEMPLPLDPETPLANTARSLAPSLPSASPLIPPDAMNTAVDRLLETTGLSAREFMQMLEDRAFVGDAERHKVRGDPGQREG